MFWYLLHLVLALALTRTLTHTPAPSLALPLPLPLTRYVLHLLHGVGSWAQFHNARWKVDHFWGGGKPWLLGYPRASYLRRLELPATPTTRCQRHLSASTRQLKQQGRWEKSDGPSPKQHAVLPALSILG